MRSLGFHQMFCCISVLMASCLPAMSAPSGLNVIPTADVLDESMVSLEIESVGTGTPWGGDCDSFALLQFGVGRGIEFGLDRSTSGSSDHWLNAKWRVLDESRTTPAVALGTQTVSKNDHPQPFAVATRRFGRMRLHGGIIDIERKTRCMVGVDHSHGSRFTFQADYISGNENSASFGVVACLNCSLSLTVARSIGNSVDSGDGYVVNFAWSTPLK